MAKPLAGRKELQSGKTLIVGAAIRELTTRLITTSTDFYVIVDFNRNFGGVGGRQHTSSRH